MIFQIVDNGNKRLHLWTGSAANALSLRADMLTQGRRVAVADYRGRKVHARELRGIAARESDRPAASSLAIFARITDPTVAAS